MKKLFVILFVLLLTARLLPQNKEYSLTLNSGVSLPGNDFSYAYNTGFNVGIDFQNYNRFFSAFAELNGNFFKIKDEYSYGNSKYKEILELTLGPRLFFKLKSVYPFFDIGAGIYLTDFPDVTVRTGINIGIGAVINLYKKFDILLKAKYHPYYVSGQSGYGDYFGFYSGVKYNFDFWKEILLLVLLF